MSRPALPARFSLLAFFLFLSPLRAAAQVPRFAEISGQPRPPG